MKYATAAAFGQALDDRLKTAVFIMVGALLLGTAVANTIAGSVTVSAGQAVGVIGSGALAAVL